MFDFDRKPLFLGRFARAPGWLWSTVYPLALGRSPVPVAPGLRIVAGVLLVFSVAGSGVVCSDVPGSLPDRAREQRLRDQIVDGLLDGEPIELRTAAGVDFLAIRTNSVTRPARGSVVILHGRGFHPDWADVVHPLRVGLTEHGWDTLSVQLPVLDKAAKYYDYYPVFPAAGERIEAALAAARNLSAGKVVLIAHSCGSHMAQHWMLSNDPETRQPFDAFVGIGMGATDFRQPMRDPFALDRLKVPVLDLYGDDDYPAVHRLADERLAALRVGGNPASVQIVVPHADHYFRDRGEELLKAVSDWLDTL